MALLGTYIDTAVVSLGAFSTVSVAHSLPTQPDWCGFTSLYTIANTIALLTRAATAVVWFNGGGSAVPGEQFLIFCHSIMR